MTDDELADLDALPLKALRTRVAELEADIPLKWQPVQDELHAVIDTLRAENARLRGTLKEIADSSSDIRSPDANVLAYIAEKALNPPRG